MWLYDRFYCIVVIRSLSRDWLFATPWTAAFQASLSFTSSWSLLKLTSIESVMPSNRLILCRPLLLLPSVLPSVRVFFKELAPHIKWPNYWSFAMQHPPSQSCCTIVCFTIECVGPSDLGGGCEAASLRACPLSQAGKILPLPSRQRQLIPRNGENALTLETPCSVFRLEE